MNPVVLVTDADREYADLLVQFLARQGYAAETASGGLECLDKLRRLSPEVLVLDRELPWGGGDGVLACLREDVPTPRPAVVLTTRDAEWPAERLDAPVVGCLRKPIHLAELLKSLAEARDPLA